jgi:hypothetical protein
MSKYLLVFLLILAARGLLADDFKTVDGKEYKNVTVSRAEPDGIVLITSSGISKVYFTELSKEVQERFHYDSAKASAYSAEQAATQEAFRKQQIDLERKLAAENNKYWIDRESAKNQHVNGVRKIQQDSVRQGKVTAHDAAKEKARQINHNDPNLVQEIGAKRKLLNSIGGQF